MQWLANVSVRRPVFATVLVLGICVLGLAGYSQLGVDRFPKIDAPFVTVNTRLPGAAPEEVETEVTDKLEEAVNTISGIDELRSISQRGRLAWSSSASSWTRTSTSPPRRCATRSTWPCRACPRDVEQPAIMQHRPRRPRRRCTSRSTASCPLREMTEVADKIVRRQIENVTGVGQVVVLGGRKRQVNVWIDPLKLRAFGLTAFDVQRALASAEPQPAGRVAAGRARAADPAPARAGCRAPSRSGALVLRNQDGRAVRVADVARVEDGQEEGETLAIRNGERGRGAVGAQAVRRQHRRGGRRRPRAHGRDRAAAARRA